MIARIRKAMEEKEEGFTLIELLVVIIIIGILAAIAIPVFLNQRKKAVDSSMKSDLRTVANAAETYFTDSQAYPAAANVTQAGQVVTVGAADNTARVSTGNTITYALDGADGFCVAAANPNGSHGWAYKSKAGGLQPAATTDCS
jgi:type IV pilus assembly protein PilA